VALILSGGNLDTRLLPALLQGGDAPNQRQASSVAITTPPGVDR
jgi:hypothetical protein